MKFGKSIKTIWKFAIDNYFLSIFLAVIVFVVIISAYKLFLPKPTYIYAKIKVSQGLWWATTAKPYIWFVKAIKKGDVEVDLVGKPIAEILSIRYYPWFGSEQYVVYLNLKLRVSNNKKTGKYTFKRSTIGVASPIDLEFPSVQLSGTIIDINDQPLKDMSIEKTITLTKKNAYPWEYEAIQIGDSYFDGEETMFSIIDKAATETRILIEDAQGNYPIDSEQRRYIVLKAKMKMDNIDNQLFFGPEQKITLGRTINISTNKFTFNDYTISKVE